MKVLELIFLTDLGKTTRITVDDPQEPIDTEVVKSAMQSIIESNVFIDSDGNSYSEIKGARLVERSVTEYEIL
ncbi:MAG TPA: DUF2922 domain-containing protein [Bacillaceae bacterium]|nr:DUF2922 domain-containing protein [Bacillaceae bacterium]